MISSIEEIRAKKRRGLDLTDEEFALLSNFWKSDYASPEFEARGRTYKVGDYPNSPLEPQDQTPERDPNRLTCSFCFNDVSHFEATYGRQNFKPKKVEEWDESTEPPTLRVRWIHSSRKVVACPNCSLKIEPSLEHEDKEDPDSPLVYKGHNVRYSEFPTD